MFHIENAPADGGNKGCAEKKLQHTQLDFAIVALKEELCVIWVLFDKGEQRIDDNCDYGKRNRSCLPCTGKVDYQHRAGVGYRVEQLAEGLAVHFLIYFYKQRKHCCQR